MVPRTPLLPPIAVRPYVFALDRRPELTLNPEVAAARWVPLDLLLHPETYHTVRLEIRGRAREFPAYRLDESVVWGLTERILTSLFEQLQARIPDSVKGEAVNGRSLSLFTFHASQPALTLDPPHLSFRHT